MKFQAENDFLKCYDNNGNLIKLFHIDKKNKRIDFERNAKFYFVINYDPISIEYSLNHNEIQDKYYEKEIQRVSFFDYMGSFDSGIQIITEPVTKICIQDGKYSWTYELGKIICRNIKSKLEETFTINQVE